MAGVPARRDDGSIVMSDHLNSAHRKTVERIFSHPTSANIEWREVRSLLDALGASSTERNGKLQVTLGGETETVELPRTKDVDRQTIVDLRRMLKRSPDLA